MFEGLKLPKKITPSPIVEAVFEIRFSSDIPGTAMCGLFYPVISRLFPASAIEELPILQLPPVVRDNDPNLKFKPHYKVARNNYIFAFGPNSISFTCLEPYSGWNKWSDFFLPILDGLAEVEVLKNTQITRLGLRYIDNIEGNMFENTKTTFCISDTSLAPYNTQIRSEFVENDITVILTMANRIRRPNKPFFSIFDIDCVANCKTTFVSFKNDIVETCFLNNLHDTNKKYFFGLLKDEYLKKLKPED